MSVKTIGLENLEFTVTKICIESIHLRQYVFNMQFRYLETIFDSTFTNPRLNASIIFISLFAITDYSIVLKTVVK